MSDYDRGYAAARRGSDTALDRADARGESNDWYAGYEDAAAGRPKRAQR